MEVNDLFIYGVKVAIILAIFYVVYHFFMHHRTTYAWNRAYLLSALFLALVIPIIEIPLAHTVDKTAGDNAIYLVIESEWILERIRPDNLDVAGRFSWISFIGTIYLLVSGLFILRLLFHLGVFYHLKSNSAYVKNQKLKLYQTRHSRPFSFFSSVFIPEELFGTRAFDKIMAHE